MYRLLTALLLVAAPGAVTGADVGPGHPGLEDGHVENTALPGFPELAALLEDRVSSLDGVIGIQRELLSLAGRDPGAAWLARPDISRCELVLPDAWCRKLVGTFSEAEP